MNFKHHKISAAFLSFAALGISLSLGTVPANASAKNQIERNNVSPKTLPGDGGSGYSWYECIHGLSGHTIPPQEYSTHFDNSRSGYVELNCGTVRHINYSHKYYDSNTNSCINNVLKNWTYHYDGSGPGNVVYELSFQDDYPPFKANSNLNARPFSSDLFEAFVVVHISTKQIYTAYTNGGKGGSAQWNECKTTP